MKKLISAILCLVFIFSFAAETFAAEMQVFFYAPEDEIIRILENEESYLVKSLEEDGLMIDAKKVIPVFHATFEEYTERGVLKYKANLIDGKPLYACDVFDKNGEHVGYITFTENGLMMYAPKESGGGTSIDYSVALNIAGVENCIFARLMWLEGAGYVFYTESTDEEYLVKSYIKGSNDDLFSKGKKISLSEAFSLIEGNPKESPNNSSVLVPGENPPTGAALPAGILAVIILSAAVVSKKR